MRKYDTFWKRLAAAIIDGLILFPLTYIDSIAGGSANSLLSSAVIFISSSLYILYFVILHGRYGQTLGKKAMRVKVMDVNEVDLIGHKRAALRELPWIIVTFVALVLMLWRFSILSKYHNYAEQKYNDFSSVISLAWMIIELLTMLTNNRRRALHDWMAKSVVLKVN